MITENRLLTEQPTAFQFRMSFSAYTILQMLHDDLDDLSQQLNKIVLQTPNFFHGALVVIDLEKIQLRTGKALAFHRLKEILRSHHMIPIGIQKATMEQQLAAAAEGLQLVNLNKSTGSETQQKTTKPAAPRTTLINYPVRSGMQVYAKEGDLIVLAPVSRGAELMADGHIHVYGPLRGRALAGMQGDMSARIFCRDFEAELVAIAGFYLTRENMKILPAKNEMIQIYLQNDEIQMESLHSAPAQ